MGTAAQNADHPRAVGAVYSLQLDRFQETTYHSPLANWLLAFGWTLPSLSFLLGAGVVPKHPNAEPAQPTGLLVYHTHKRTTSATNEYDCHNTTTTTTHPTNQFRHI